MWVYPIGLDYRDGTKYGFIRFSLCESLVFLLIGTNGTIGWIYPLCDLAESLNLTLAFAALRLIVNTH